jgi:hypothetical protein
MGGTRGMAELLQSGRGLSVLWTDVLDPERDTADHRIHYGRGARPQCRPRCGDCRACPSSTGAVGACGAVRRSHADRCLRSRLRTSARNDFKNYPMCGNRLIRVVFGLGQIFPLWPRKQTHFRRHNFGRLAIFAAIGSHPEPSATQSRRTNGPARTGQWSGGTNYRAGALIASCIELLRGPAHRPLPFSPKR